MTTNPGFEMDSYENKKHFKDPNIVESTPTTNGGPVVSDDDPETGQKKPLWLCKLIVNHTKKYFAITLAMNTMLFVISFVLIAAGYDLLPLEFEDSPMNIRDNKYFLRQRAWLNRDEEDDLVGKNTSWAEIGERTLMGDSLKVVFKNGKNVLTKARLQAIQRVENDLMNHTDYKKFCRVTEDQTACRLPKSLIRFFDGTRGPEDRTFSNISGILYDAMQRPKDRDYMESMLSKKAIISPQTAESSVTKFEIELGIPLVGFDMKSDNRDDQDDKLQDFQVDSWEDTLENLNSDGIEGMDVYYFSTQLFFHAIFPQVIKDLMLSVGSMMFIFLFILFHTRSLLLTYFALFSIISSFVGTNLIYRVVFQYAFFGIFHVLSIFIILGIGADNVFLFIDTWRLTFHENHKSLELRLTECYRRASKAMFITSLTTGVAFISNALSPLLAPKAFGLFSAILVLFNYLNVVIFYPGVVILHHKYWAEWTWPCFRSFKCCKRNEDEEEKKNVVVRFFDGPFFRLITHKIARWILLATTSAIIIFFIVYATQLESSSSDVQYLKDSNQYQKYLDIDKDSFQQRAIKDMDIMIIWGLKHQDMSDCHVSDYKCKGKTVWDDSFDLNPKPVQIALRDFCNRLLNMPEEESNRYRMKRNYDKGTTDVECFVTELDTFLQNHPTNSSTALSLPTTDAKMAVFFNDNDHLYNASSIDDMFYRYFETVTFHWLSDGHTKTDTETYRTYSPVLGQTRDKFDTHPVLIDPDKLYGTRMRYAAIIVHTDLQIFTLGYEEGLDIVDLWEDLVEENKKLLPSQLSGGFQVNPDDQWHNFEVQKVLVYSAMQGIIVGIILAFVVLVFATGNFIVGSLATLNIIFVTTTIMGLIPLVGWELGVLESINLSLVVGLAVDYVVHLAEAYHMAEATDRLGRVRHMLEAVGVSILSGAITTIGASIFIMGAEITFFFQFGIFIFSIIGFSLLFSLFFFSVILGLIGPQNNTGSIHILWLRFKYWWVGRNKNDVDCRKCHGKGFHSSYAE